MANRPIMPSKYTCPLKGGYHMVRAAWLFPLTSHGKDENAMSAAGANAAAESAAAAAPLGTRVEKVEIEFA